MKSHGLGQNLEPLNDTFLNQAKDDLEKLEIEAIKIEKAEDAVAAASAELIESLTVGVAEAAGAEAGEEAGSLAAADAAQVRTSNANFTLFSFRKKSWIHMKGKLI